MARRFGSKDKNDQRKLSVNREEIGEALKIFSFIKPYRFHFIGGLILLALSSLVFMIFLYLPGQMIDIAQGNSDAKLSLSDLGWIMLAMLIIQGLVSYFRIMLFATVSEKGTADIRKALYEKMITMPIAFFDENRIGDIISRLTADVDQLYSTFSIVLAELVRQIIILVGGIIFIAIFAKKLALIMLATFPIVVVLAIFFGRYIRQLSKKRQKALADSNIILSETTQSISAVKGFSNELFEVNRYDKAINSVVTIALKFAGGRALFAVFIVAVLFGALFFIIWKGALMLQTGEMTAGELVNFVVYTGAIGGAIAGLGNFYGQLLGAIGATERIREILKSDSEVLIADAEKQTLVPIKGNIKFNNVKFSYPTRKDVEVLKGISFEMQAGKKIALVGSSGAGKSTIMQLLLRFYELDGGEILVDGKNIEDFNITGFRKNFAIVPQEVLLFGGTIRENILYGKPDAIESELMDAARQSNSLEFIQSFPDGFETIVGERGVKLSGGQRQRVAIARAILRNPSVLLLDEATSSLDAESEKVVQDALNKLMEGRTSLIIAHRLSTIREADQIYVIGDGKIIEQGTHEVLSKKEDGAYNHFAKLQFELN